MRSTAWRRPLRRSRRPSARPPRPRRGRPRRRQGGEHVRGEGDEHDGRSPRRECCTGCESCACCDGCDCCIGARGRNVCGWPEKGARRQCGYKGGAGGEPPERADARKPDGGGVSGKQGQSDHRGDEQEQNDDPYPTTGGHGHRAIIAGRAAPPESVSLSRVSKTTRGATMADKIERVMVVTAHPDDSEFGAGGTIAKMVKEGREATYLIATNGNKGSSDRSMTPERLPPSPEGKQRKPPRTPGAGRGVFLG